MDNARLVLAWKGNTGSFPHSVLRCWPTQPQRRLPLGLGRVEQRESQSQQTPQRCSSVPGLMKLLAGIAITQKPAPGTQETEAAREGLAWPRSAQLLPHLDGQVRALPWASIELWGTVWWPREFLMANGYAREGHSSWSRSIWGL